MAAERLEDSDKVLAGRESLCGWVSGGLPDQEAKVIEFPLKPTVENPVYIADKFAQGEYWEKEVDKKPQAKSRSKGVPVQINLNEADYLDYQILVEQEQIEAETPAYGIHSQRRRYPGGFPKDEWNHNFGVKK